MNKKQWNQNLFNMVLIHWRRSSAVIWITRLFFQLLLLNVCDFRDLLVRTLQLCSSWNRGGKKKTWKKYLLVAHKLHDLYSSSNFSRWCPLARFAARAEITTKLAKFLSLSSFYHHVKSSNNQGSSPPLVNLIEPTRPPKWKVVKKSIGKRTKMANIKEFSPFA